MNVFDRLVKRLWRGSIRWMERRVVYLDTATVNMRAVLKHAQESYVRAYIAPWRGTRKIGPIIPPALVVPMMTEEQKEIIVQDFLEVWPNAEYGPARLVMCLNLDEVSIAYCRGLLDNEREQRGEGYRGVYWESHSNNELEATARMLLLLQFGRPLSKIDFQKGTSQELKWEDVGVDRV